MMKIVAQKMLVVQGLRGFIEVCVFSRLLPDSPGFAPGSGNLLFPGRRRTADSWPPRFEE
jgi:hypothetical protein